MPRISTGSASGSRTLKHGPGVALHSDLEVGLFENLDLAGPGTDGRGFLAKHKTRARRCHRECGQLLHGNHPCYCTIQALYACLSLLSSRFPKSGKCGASRIGSTCRPVCTFRSGLRVGAVGVVAAAWVLIEFGGLGRMSGAARVGRRLRLRWAVRGLVPFRSSMIGCRMDSIRWPVRDAADYVGCFRMLFAHGYTSFLPAILGNGRGSWPGRERK